MNWHRDFSSTAAGEAALGALLLVAAIVLLWVVSS